MKKSLEPKHLPRHLSSLKKIKTNVSNKKKRKVNNVNISELKLPGIKPQIVSSIYGKIKTILLFFPTKKGRTIYPYFKFIQELVSKLKGERIFILVLESYQLTDQELKMLSDSATENGNHFYSVFIIYNDYDLGPWAQDSFLSIKYDVNGYEKTYLVEPCNGYKRQNIGYELVKGLKSLEIGVSCLEHQYSPIPFVGGNVLATDRFILIGIHGTKRRAIKELGEKWLGKNIILLESKPTTLYNYWTQCKVTNDGYCNKYEADVDKQALFHLDLFITLAGKGKNDQEIFVIGDPVIGFSLTDDISDDIKLLVRQIIMETKKAIDEIILQLKEALWELGIAFKIVRNPLPLIYFEEINGSSKVRYWSWASYNNCLVESYYTEKGLDSKVVKNIIMPSYGINSDYSSEIDPQTGHTCGVWTDDLHRYDLQNKWIWEDILNYKVFLMRQDYNGFARRQGSLNCLTNTLERE